MDAGGRSPAIGKVYFRTFEIIQNISKMNELLEEDSQTITQFANNRWAMLHTDMQSAGYVLDPEYNF